MEQDWASIHLRSVKGEKLSVEEEMFYRQGLEQRHKAETISFDVEKMKRLRATIQRMETERVALEAKRQSLHSQITQIEANFSHAEKEFWGLGE